MIQLDRRGFLRGTGLVLAAPAIVQVGNIMPVFSSWEYIALDGVKYKFIPNPGEWEDLYVVSGHSNILWKKKTQPKLFVTEKEYYITEHDETYPTWPIVR